ncbi:MAG: FAD-dependent monooxygenase [Silvibacterium sp.]|nr:FAD-dependent monooxygenase [Silvibacterium sp.]
MDTDVLIVGAGPVGLTLAFDLGRRGVRCTLVEKKSSPHMWPKMERCNPRSMEIFRRLGLSDRIRAAGMPAWMPLDVFIVLSLVEPPLVHLPYPSVQEAKERIRACHDGTMPLEPNQLISQYTLEPLLKAAVEAQPLVTVRYGCEFLSLAQDGRSVTAEVLEDGHRSKITAQYLVGCDGGTSSVRKQLGIKLAGEGNILQLRQALFHCEELFERIPIGKGRHYHVADTNATQLVMQDSTRHFTLHSVAEKDEDMAAIFERTIAMPIKYEMLYVGEWRQNLLLAEKYREGRVLLAGDAVHLVIPTGGLGMNTGVGDAFDLGWKLAGTIQGWGGQGLLDSYEIERRPVAANNIAAVRHASAGRRQWRSLCTPEIRDETPAGAALRQRVATIASSEQRKTHEMKGAEIGYHYSGSPLVASEQGDEPFYDFIEYKPSTSPGARLPHIWLPDGRAVHDCIGDGYTLLLLGNSTADGEPLADAFNSIGAPFSTIDLAGDEARSIYGYDLILVRPDLHVVWRANELPSNPKDLAAIATGHKLHS